MYKNYRYKAFTFVFKFDDSFPDLHSIYARHRKTPEDAIEVWLEGDHEIWNEKFKRFETSTESITIYWYWIETDKVIMIISCFDNQRK